MSEGDDPDSGTARAQSLDSRELPAIRRRILGGLFASSGVAGIGTFSAFTTVNVLGAELLRDPTWSGLPGTFILLGSAGSAAGLSNYMAQSGRRRGLVVGYVVGALGSILAVVSTSAESFALLLIAMLVFGFGATAIQLSRYAAADVSPVEVRGKAISLITWASVVGAVIGPNLVGSSGRIADSVRLPASSGPFLLSIAGFSIAAALIASRLRPDPLEVARRLEVETDTGAATAGARALPGIFALPRVQIAIVAMAVGQLVMVLVMSMTAVHMRAHAHSWGAVGFVISAHLLGMFALSPLSGWASDRIGRAPVIVAGAFTLIAAALLAASSPNSSLTLTPALFLVGFGWNLGNVAGSALLTDALLPQERARMQGVAELIGSSMSAVGGGVSGVILGALGFANLSVIGATLMIFPLLLIFGRRRALRPVAEAAAG